MTVCRKRELVDYNRRVHGSFDKRAVKSHVFTKYRHKEN